MSKDRGSNIPLERVIHGVRDLSDTIWGRLAQVKRADGPARIVFTSTEAQSGNTVVAASTALGLARNLRAEVCLLEANLKRPSVARYMGLPPTEPGVSDILYGSTTLQQSLQEVVGCPGLLVLGAGTARSPIPGEFATRPARAMLEQVSKLGSYVLIDAPPVLDHPETRILLEYADGVVLVVRARTSRRDRAARLVEIMEEVGVPVLGSVLNRFKSEVPFDKRWT